MQNSPSSEATSCSVTHSIPCLLHNTSVHYYFHHSPTHTLPPNSFSPPTFCSHIYSSLNNTAITVHIFSALQTQCWHTKMRDKKWDIDKSSNPLSNSPISNWHKQQLMKLQPHTSPTSSQTHPKLPLLKRHNQNPNITTLQILTVLLQWLCCEVWEREFGYLRQQRICYCVCSMVYRYIMATKSRVACPLWL